mmetsp:Transcript_6880/g.10881  ORF Transcript_6880/g.10881 Transcript_6880/m.10881 type:complete len:646 (+) Transcript_6880:35-1972(+)
MNFVDLTEDNDEAEVEVVVEEGNRINKNSIIRNEFTRRRNDRNLSYAKGRGRKRKELNNQKAKNAKKPDPGNVQLSRKEEGGVKRKPGKNNTAGFLSTHPPVKTKYQPIGIEYSVDVIDMVDDSYADQSQEICLDDEDIVFAESHKKIIGDQKTNSNGRKVTVELDEVSNNGSIRNESRFAKEPPKTVMSKESSLSKNQKLPSDYCDGRGDFHEMDLNKKTSIDKIFGSSTCDSSGILLRMQSMNASDEQSSRSSRDLNGTVERVEHSSQLNREHSGLVNNFLRKLKERENNYVSEKKTSEVIIVDFEMDRKGDEKTLREAVSGKSRAQQHRIDTTKCCALDKNEREIIKERKKFGTEDASQRLRENIDGARGGMNRRQTITCESENEKKKSILCKKVYINEKQDVQGKCNSDSILETAKSCTKDSLVSSQERKTNDVPHSNVIVIDGLSDGEEKRNVGITQPNFIMIDDSSDEDEDQVFEMQGNHQVKKASLKQSNLRPRNKATQQPSRPHSQNSKFSFGQNFNYQRSNEEALAEQELLFSQSAARLRNHRPFLKEMRRQENFSSTRGPTFTLPVVPEKLNDHHWKWTCVHARLGLPKDADDDTIKRQYRKLALCYHPDKCRLPDASLRFQAVTEAYNKLKKTC